MINKETVHNIAQNIANKYDILLNSFNEITLTAQVYFENQQYQDLFTRQQERYRLYGKFVKEVLQETQLILVEDLYNVEYWKLIKIEFSAIIETKPHKRNSETFFNSITRKVFVNKSFNSDYEFFDYNDYKPVANAEEKIFDVIECSHFSKIAIKQVLKYFKFNVPYEDLERDAQRIFDEIAPIIIYQKANLYLERIEVLKPVFYRNRGAFLIGRLFYKNWSMPFAIPLLNEENGIFVDSIIYSAAEISIVFSFTRASFFVYTKFPALLIDYMKGLLPHKSVGELYDSIGYYRHGKTILYRDLMNYIYNHEDKFIVAPGIKGMVMAVFTLKYYNLVFKIIRDKFEAPKNCTREFVIKKYEEVEINDRVGRMAYAHLFENLQFPRNLFTHELIRELLDTCKESVEFKGDIVLIKHVYIERKMTPLNLYLQNEKNPINLCRVILDYGFCVKELAAANIFPGDLLLKKLWSHQAWQGYFL